MTQRKPEILDKATFDQHHGVMFYIVLRAMKGEPIERCCMTPLEALEFAESLVRSAKQSLR